MGICALGMPRGSAFAQSAEDKATARELASEGIRRLKNGDAAGALVKLEKAQALYDAPVHLLYIARAHVDLGQLVEGAETYRLLARAKLAEDAPTVFHDAQREGEKELASLEPRIARLTVEVTPEDAAELSVVIDGKSIKVAALGVARATNPGHHVVTVQAPGYEPVERQLDLAEGKSATVSVELVQKPGETPPEPTAVDKEVESEGEAPRRKGLRTWESGSMGFIAGAKIAGVMPLGQLEQDTAMGNYFGPGVAARVELGFRFLKYIGIKGFLGGSYHQPGKSLNSYGEYFPVDSDVLIKQGEAGVSLLFTADPRKLGGFGELGWSIARAFSWKLTPVDESCKSIAEYSGWGAHVGGGVNVPLARLFTLVPYGEFSFGQLKNRAYQYDCVGIVQEEYPDEDPYPDKPEEKLDRAMHFQIMLGVGGDFHFGDDWFR